MTAMTVNTPTVPNVGELWTLTLDGVQQGRALIAAIKDGFALVWPVTTPREPVFAPALTLDRDHPCRRLQLWPTRETGIDLRLLGQKEDVLMCHKRVVEIGHAIDNGDNPGLKSATGSVDDPNNMAANLAMIDHWADLCFAFDSEDLAS